MKKLIILMLLLPQILFAQNIDPKRKDALYKSAYAIGFNKGFLETVKTLKEQMMDIDTSKKMDTAFNSDSVKLIGVNPEDYTMAPVILPIEHTQKPVSTTYSVSPSKLYSKTNVAKNKRLDWKAYIFNDLDSNSSALKKEEVVPVMNEKEKIYWTNLFLNGKSDGEDKSKEITESNLNDLKNDMMGMMYAKGLYTKGLITAPK